MYNESKYIIYLWKIKGDRLVQIRICKIIQNIKHSIIMDHAHLIFWSCLLPTTIFMVQFMLVDLLFLNTFHTVIFPLILDVLLKGKIPELKSIANSTEFTVIFADDKFTSISNCQVDRALTRAWRTNASPIFMPR